MNDREIDEILKQAVRAPSHVDPAVLDRISATLGRSLRPVRPLPPVWALVCGLVLACTAVAVAGAARAGFYGVELLTGSERAVIFATIGILIWLAATASVSEMIPGSRRRVLPGALPGVGSLMLVAIFAILFQDYRTDGFLHEGIVCLMTGLLCAIPAALLIWLILRRGFAVNSNYAGLAVGTLAGLAGITMLELHCPNFKTLHLMIWHTAVVPVSAATGAFVGWVLRSGGSVGDREGSAPL